MVQRLAWGTLLLLAGVVAAPLAVAGPPEPEVLVIDFIGLNDDLKRSNHPETFKETVLPAAQIVRIGTHGIIPDAWRKNAGYDAIIPAGSAAERAHSAERVRDMIKSPQTVVAFDFNESKIPQQAKEVLIEASPYPPAMEKAMTGAAPVNKIKGTALVAATVAEGWLRDHPGGRLVLRGHSDGTWALGYIFDALKAQGVGPAAVIVESPRQPLSDWIKRAASAPGTKFISINANLDLPRKGLVDPGYHRAALPNMVNLNITDITPPPAPAPRTLWGVILHPWSSTKQSIDYLGQFGRRAMEAHSIVTRYGEPVKIDRLGTDGASSVQGVRLGEVVARELATVMTRVSAPPLPGGSLPRAAAPGRGGIDTHVNIKRGDFAR